MKRVKSFLDRKATADPAKCWPFPGAECKTTGYRTTTYLGKRTPAHRAVYEFLHGSVGELHVDHLCRNRACANPAHLEAVTNRENLYRSPVMVWNRGIDPAVYKTGDYVTAADIAAELGVQRYAVLAHAKKGNIPTAIKGEGPVGVRLFRREDAEAFIAQRKAKRAS